METKENKKSQELLDFQLKLEELKEIKRNKDKEIKELFRRINDEPIRKKISLELFLNFHNQVSLFRFLHPDEFYKNIEINEIIAEKDKNNKRHPKTENKEEKISERRLNDVTTYRCFKEWDKYFDTKIEYEERKGKGGVIIKYPKKLKRLNLNMLFEYMEVFNVQLTQIEKNILSFLFYPAVVREYIEFVLDFGEFENTNFIEMILIFYFRNFYHPYLLNKANLGKPYDSLSEKAVKLLAIQDKTLKLIMKTNISCDEDIKKIFTSEKGGKAKYSFFYRTLNNNDISDQGPYLDYLTLIYISFQEKYPKIMKELDGKVLTALKLNF